MSVQLEEFPQSSGLIGHSNQANTSNDVNALKGEESRKSIEIAEYLLDKKLYLSALEYYFEQLERGKSIKILHEFFTSPNFVDNLNNLSSVESPSLLMGKYPSLSSLDSSDIGRISDDGNTVEEKLKVLEYELRKKNDEISTLRNELTNLVACGFKGGSIATSSQAADSTLGTHLWHNFNSGTQKTLPHELRALSFLINEYLLEQNFRLTAIQFAEEVEEHNLPSLESWHEVAINLRKPPSLLSLLRSYWYPSAGQSSQLSSNRTEVLTRSYSEASVQTESEQNVYTVTVGFGDQYSTELQSKNEEIVSLKSKISHLELECSSAIQNARDLHNQLICLRREHAEMMNKSVLTKRTTTNGNNNTTSTTTNTNEVNDSTDSDSVSNSPKMCNFPDRTRKSNRNLSKEFSKYITHLLPDDDVTLNEINQNFRLTDSLDEFVIFLAQHTEKILSYLVDKGKLIFLPLLVQIICLHPNSSVRDRFLGLLFDFFSSTSTISTSALIHSPSLIDNKIYFDFNLSNLTSMNYESTTSVNNSINNHNNNNNNNTGSSNKSSHNEYSKHILNALGLLASYLGPARLEGELLPSLWLQINKCSTDASRRLLLVSACGVIAPHLPAHLQSSIMLSIIESSLDEERDPVILSASIRSLSCLVSSMSDSHKLPQIIRRLNSFIMQTIYIFNDKQQQYNYYLSNKSFSILLTSNPIYNAVMNWFLPSVAQWCLELDSLHQILLDPWLIHFDNYILACQNTKEVAPDMILLYLNILYYLAPFLHAWLLLSIIVKNKTDNSNEGLWTAMQNLISVYHNSVSEFEHLLKQNFNSKEPELVKPSSTCISINTSMILGQDSCNLLEEMLKYACQSDKATTLTTPTPAISPTPTSSTVHQSVGIEQSFYQNHTYSIDKWIARQWFDKHLISKLIILLEQLPYCRDSGRCSTMKAFLDLDYENCSFDDVIKHQYDEYFAYPCMESLQSNNFKVCFAICRFLVSLGSALKSDAVTHLIAPHFKVKLMKPTEHGNYEYDHNSMQTGLLAGYCCLLASTQSKSELGQVRMLLTSAIFLHAREGFPLHCITLTIWCLCLTTNLETIIQDILLPAIRPCLSCADSSVRRAVVSLLHAFIEIIRFISGWHNTAITTTTATTTTTNTGNSSIGATTAISSSGCSPLLHNDIYQCHLLELIWPFVSQITRDDVTGQRKRITPDQADWSVLCCSLGPLYAFIMLVCVPFLNSTHLSSTSATATATTTTTITTNTNATIVDTIGSCKTDNNISTGMENVPLVLTTDAPKQTLLSEYASYRTMAFDLLSLQYDLVIGRATTPSNELNARIDYTMDRLIISQHRFWSTLVHNLLELTNRLLPTCDENFQQNNILPWLFNLAEMNNALPNLDQRTELANHLFTVFSTAAYCILFCLHCFI
uniref:LisH domain-containing protein n=1 Tax=Trichobilharzia regenti TaxID=157069 RepID=A0AA85JE79_TRIRE|nr:unnamed protein product [Trichobilharzia regenti]